MAERLRHGHISADRIHTIIARTDLVDGTHSAAHVDAEIAAELDLHHGGWSAHRIRIMVDRIVFRHDPNAVREARRRATGARRFWTRPLADGMAQVSATMTAENAQIAAAAVTALADAPCAHDGRTVGQRRSDAVFALLTGTGFECLCGRADCPAQIPEPGVTPAGSSGEVSDRRGDRLDGVGEQSTDTAGDTSSGRGHAVCRSGSTSTDFCHQSDPPTAGTRFGHDDTRGDCALQAPDGWCLFVCGAAPYWASTAGKW